MLAAMCVLLVVCSVRWKHKDTFSWPACSDVQPYLRACSMPMGHRGKLYIWHRGWAIRSGQNHTNMYRTTEKRSALGRAYLPPTTVHRCFNGRLILVHGVFPK